MNRTQIRTQMQLAAALGALALAAAAHGASVTNPGFESGLAGWEPTGIVQVRSSFSYVDWLTGATTTYTPTEGANMAYLEAGTGRATEQFADLFQNLGGPLTQPTAFSYNFISFELADAGGAIVGRDFVTIFALDQNFNPLAETTFGVTDLMALYAPQSPSPNLNGDFGWSSGWRSFLAPAGTFALQITLESAIADINAPNGRAPDDFVQSFALFDVSPVPEPSTYALLLAGLGLMGVVARRRMRA